MNYLVKMIKHDTGEVFADVLKIKDNETYKVIEAESREEALEMAKRPKGLLEVVPSSFNSCRSISKPIPDRKHATPPRKDSEGMNIEDTRFLCRRTHGDFKEGVYYYIIPTHIIIKEGSNDDGEYRWFCPNVNSLIKENALTRDFIQVRKDSE